MNEPREDRRVSRTKRLLLDGLIALIHERGFESVTVQEIALRANVGRSTFYAHFSSKEELLLGGFDRLEASLLDELRRKNGRRDGRLDVCFAFSLPLLEHFHAQRRLFQATVGHQSGAATHRRVQQLVTALVREELAAAGARRGEASPPLDALVQFVVGAFFGLGFWWFHSAPHLTPREVDALFRRLVLPGVQAALAG